MALREAGRYTERGGRGHNVKTSRGSSPAPGLQTPRGSSPRISWTDRDSGVARRPSCISVSSVTVDVDSCASSPGIRRRPAVTEFSFAEMKRALAEPTQREKEEAERARRAMLERFQTASFSELCEMSAASRPAHTETLYQCLSDIYSKVHSSAQLCVFLLMDYFLVSMISIPEHLERERGQQQQEEQHRELQLRHHGCPQDRDQADLRRIFPGAVYLLRD